MKRRTRLEPFHFTIPEKEYKRLQGAYSNRGKNSHVGKYGVEVVSIYLKSLGGTNIILEPQKGADLSVELNNKVVLYEIKATTDKKVAFGKLKVSSVFCYDSLKNGMVLIRVSKIGEQTVDIYFLKHGIDFNMVPEPRWRLSKTR
jgi:hypothetical protein